jgi:hypothetical protein
MICLGVRVRMRRAMSQIANEKVPARTAAAAAAASAAAAAAANAQG